MTVRMIKVPGGWRRMEEGEESCGHCKGCGCLIAPGLVLCGPCSALAQHKQAYPNDTGRENRYADWDAALKAGCNSLVEWRFKARMAS